jgi:hypothetical protein
LSRHPVTLPTFRRRVPCPNKQVRLWLEDRGARPVLLVAASPSRKASAVLQRVLEKGSAKDKRTAGQLQTQVMRVESKG